MASAKNHTIWKRIVDLIGDRTLTEFCKLLGLTYKTFHKSHERQNAPDTKSLTKIAAGCKVDLNWLIQGNAGRSVFQTRLGKKIKFIRNRKGWSCAKLASLVSIPPELMERIEKGTVGASMALLQEFADYLEVALAEIFQTDETPTAQIPDLKVRQPVNMRGEGSLNNEDYVSIPLTQSFIAAGQPIILEESVEDYVLLHVRAARKRNNLVACRVDGESMEPTLHSKDIVVIDRDDKKLVKNKMYAVYHEEGLTAKYVEKQRDLLILRPININSQVLVVDLKVHDDPIVGRIIGAWKEF